MGKFKGVFKAVSGILGLGSQKAPTINIPEPALPIPPAPNAMTDTGQEVSLGGAADVKNQRVSGRSATAKKRTATNDVLGGLGQSGLNI